MDEKSAASKDVVGHLDIKEGDKKLAGSAIRRSPDDADFVKAMSVADKGMKTYRKALNALSK